jgi:hypothetical protein
MQSLPLELHSIKSPLCSLGPDWGDPILKLECSGSPGTELWQTNSYTPNMNKNCPAIQEPERRTTKYSQILIDARMELQKKIFTLRGRVKNTVNSSRSRICVHYCNAFSYRTLLRTWCGKKSEYKILLYLPSIVIGLWGAEIPESWEFPVQLSLAGNHYHKLISKRIMCYPGKACVLFQIVSKSVNCVKSDVADDIYCLILFILARQQTSGKLATQQQTSCRQNI